jgi:hypothetical protein
VDNTSAPGFTVHVWDSASTGVRPPLLLDGYICHLRDRWYELVDARAQVTAFGGGRFAAAFHVGPDILSTYDAETNQAVYWVADGATIPYFERGSPLQMILSWWTSRHGGQYVHAAAVGTPTGGALVTGRGGMGKSSTALACLGSRLRFLGDDYCLVRTDPAPSVHSLYSTSKLRGKDDLQRFPRLAGLVDDPSPPADEKLMLYLHEHVPDQLIGGFPLRAVLVPRVTGRPETTVARTSPAAALRALAPSTMAQLPGAGQTALRLMGRVVAAVPCYELALGTAVEGIPAAIASVLEG